MVRRKVKVSIDVIVLGLVPKIVDTNPETLRDTRKYWEYAEAQAHEFSPEYKIQWVYGTAIALPRLAYVIRRTRKPGYHQTIIPKVPAGSFLKMAEEFEEAKDAYLTHNPIMLLTELADLYGAMELFLEKEVLGIDMENIRTMSLITKRAFENGRR